MLTKFLIDENVNQKAVRRIPIEDKEFDILYPEDGNFKSESDGWVRESANTQQRVIVTCDKDFLASGSPLQQLPSGVIWLRPSRTSQKRIGETLGKFCDLLKSTFPHNPYDFSNAVFEVYEDRVVILRARSEPQIYLFT